VVAGGEKSNQGVGVVGIRSAVSGGQSSAIWEKG
jgi:hypothetical protein